MALLGVVVVLSGVLSVGQLAIAQISVQGGAIAGARAAARGDPPAEIAAAALARAGPGASTQVAPGGPGAPASMRVTVTRHVALRLPGLPPVAVSGHAAAALETAGETAGEAAA